MTRRLTTRLLAAASALMLLQSCAATPEQQAYLTKQQAKEKERAGPQLIAYADGVHSEAAKRDLGVSSLEVAVNVSGGKLIHLGWEMLSLLEKGTSEKLQVLAKT